MGFTLDELLYPKDTLYEHSTGSNTDKFKYGLVYRLALHRCLHGVLARRQRDQLELACLLVAGCERDLQRPS